MHLDISKRAAYKGILVFILAICLSSCDLRRDSRRPSITLTRLPQATLGDPNKLDIIQGHVVGARPGQQIVLYVKTGAWWLQPLSNAPFTTLQPDSTWINSIHLGSEYAALLVESPHRPQTTMNELPTVGGDVAAITTAKGAASPPSPTIQFSGYEWRIRNAPSNRGDTMNLYDPSNVWTDENGALHLRISKRSDNWTSAEVTLTRSFGYGTYSFVVREISQLEPAAVFAMFTWDYAGRDQNNCEMGIEISRWGDPASKNAQYVVQPFYVAANVARFSAPAGVLRYSCRWEPERLSCKTLKGADSDSNQIVSEHVFTSGVPEPGAESVRMSLYTYGNTTNLLQNGAEVIIEKFEYVP